MAEASYESFNKEVLKFENLFLKGDPGGTRLPLPAFWDPCRGTGPAHDGSLRILHLPVFTCYPVARIINLAFLFCFFDFFNLLRHFLAPFLGAKLLFWWCVPWLKRARVTARNRIR